MDGTDRTNEAANAASSPAEGAAPGVERVTATPAAEALIDEQDETPGPLMFHQSGGCCDGSAPKCFPKGEFKVGAQDVLLGEVHGSEVRMGKAQFVPAPPGVSSRG